MDQLNEKKENFWYQGHSRSVDKNHCGPLGLQELLTSPILFRLHPTSTAKPENSGSKLEREPGSLISAVYSCHHLGEPNIIPIVPRYNFWVD